MQKIFQFLLVWTGILVLLSACSTQPESLAKPAAQEPILPTRSKTPKATIRPTENPASTQTPTETTFPSQTPSSHTVIAFTGVIVPARCVQAEIDRQGNADYIYHEVREILSRADVTVGVYNATMSDQIEPVGCENSWELVGSSINAPALQRAGFDVMSVATNHIKDCGKKTCGDIAFFDTLENLKKVGIMPVGAGLTLQEAMQPTFIDHNGITFGFVSLGEVNERVFADAITPGIAVLSKNNLTKAIETAKENADVVIVLPHSGPEDYPDVTLQQKYWARHAVAAGADLVVINHAHVVQGYQFLEGVPVFYSLGNFVFDQIWARDHQQGVILLVKFEGTKFIDFEFIPTVVDQDGTIHLADREEKFEILSRIEELARKLELED